MATGTTQQSKPASKQITLLKDHKHQGRDYKAGAKLPVHPSESPIAIDEDSAEWLVANETAEWV